MRKRAVFSYLKIGVFLNVPIRILKNQLGILNLQLSASEESVIKFHLWSDLQAVNFNWMLSFFHNGQKKKNKILGLETNLEIFYHW